MPPSTSPDQPKTGGFNFSQFVGEQLRTLGTVASEAAVALAIQSLGVPSVKDIVNELLGSKEQEQDNTDSAARPSLWRNTRSQPAIDDSIA